MSKLDPRLGKMFNASTGSRQSKYPRPGGYVYAIKNISSHDGDSGNYVVTELFVRSAKKGSQDNQGDTVSWLVKLSGDPTQQKMGIDRLKGFMMALAGAKKPDDVTIDDLEEGLAAEGEHSPYRGSLIACEVFEKPQKRDPTKMFTHMRWDHVAPETYSVEEVLEEMDSMTESEES